MTIQRKDGEIQKAETSITKSRKNLYVNNYLHAGTKVRDKAGGPVMVIDSFFTLKVNGEKYYTAYYNSENKQCKELSPNDVNSTVAEKIPRFILTKCKKIDEITIVFDGGLTDVLMIKCRYWSDKDEDWKFVIKTHLDIELVIEDK
jgi:hypothetical protein